MLTPAFAADDNLINELQQEAVELNTLAEAETEQVEMLDLGCGPCQEWISGKGWTEGNNPNELPRRKQRGINEGSDRFIVASNGVLDPALRNKNGGYFIVQSDSAVISAPPGHPNYISSRQNAYVKAFLKAKKNILQFIESEISREVIFDQKEGQFFSEKEAEAAASNRPEETQLQAIKRKTFQLLNATLDEKLKEKGVDPNSTDPGDKKTVEEVARDLKNSQAFSDIVRSSSQQQLKGIRRIFVNESIEKGKQGQICVVALYSPKTMAMADALFTDPSLAPSGTPNKPIKAQIPNWKTPAGVKELISTFGTEMLRDENGQFHLIAYAQSSPKSDSKTSQNLAVQKASSRAMAELRSFAQEYAVLNEIAENQELSKEYADAMAEYEGSEAFQSKISSMSGPSKINGIKKLGVWGAKHPVTGQTVVGAIVGWSPGDARVAIQMKSDMNSKPKTMQASSAKQANQFNNSAYKATHSYQGSASGGSSEDDF